MAVANKVVTLLRSAGRSKPALIRVETLDAELLFQKLTVGQAKNYTFSMIGPDHKPKMEGVKEHKVKLVQLSLVDEDGVQQTTADDLNNIDHAVLEEMFTICQRLNGMGSADPRDEQWDRFKAGRITADELCAAIKEAPGNG